MIQRDNAGSRVACQEVARAHDLGVFYRGVDDLVEQLRDRARMDALRSSVWQQRESFTFDHHADRLLAFFRRVIEANRG